MKVLPVASLSVSTAASVAAFIALRGQCRTSTIRKSFPLVVQNTLSMITNNRKFHSDNIKQFSSTNLNRNDNNNQSSGRMPIYSHEIYALPTERDYERIIPDSIEDKQTIIDLNMDIKNVLNYVLFLAYDKHSSNLLKKYQEHKNSFGKEKLVSILKLLNDHSTHNSGSKPSLQSILNKSTTDYIEIINTVNSFVQFINRELNRLDSNFSEKEDGEDRPKISDEELNSSLKKCEKDIEQLNTVFSKMYEMVDVEPLDDDIINTEHYHPIALFLKNKMRIVSIKMVLEKDNDKFNNISITLEKMEHDSDEMLAICDKIQERALLYMSTLQITRAYSDIALCTHVTKLVVAKNAERKDILMTRGLISLQNLIYMYLILKEYVVLINKQVDFDFTTEDPKDLHHFIIETFKIVQQTRLNKSEIVELTAHLSIPESISVLRNVSLQFAVLASNQLFMLKSDLEGKKIDFLDTYQKELEITLKALRLKTGLILLRKVLSFIMYAVVSIWLFRFISRKLEGEPLFK